MQPPPGRAAGALAVPSAGDELAGEVSFLFSDLDELEDQRQTLLIAARSDAARAEQTAVRERNRLLTEAHEQGERRAAMVLNERRAREQQRALAMLAEANRDAAQIGARARERIPVLGTEIVAQLLDGSS